MTASRIDIGCLFVLINVCAFFMWQGERRTAASQVRNQKFAAASLRIIDQSEAFGLAAANRAYLLDFPLDGYDLNGNGLTLTVLMEQVVAKKLDKNRLLIILVSHASKSAAGNYKKALASVWDGEIAISMVSPTQIRR